LFFSLATVVVNAMKDRGVLVGTEGPYHNVIKLKPPVVLTQEDVRHFCNLLDEQLCDMPSLLKEFLKHNPSHQPSVWPPDEFVTSRVHLMSM